MNADRSKSNESPREWRGPVVWALVGVNLLLGVVFAVGMSKPNLARAQVLRKGDYLMIPGKVNGGVTEVVYVLDMANHKLGAMAFDDSRNSLNTMKARDIDRDFDALPRRR